MHHPPVSNESREYQPDAVTATLERMPASSDQQAAPGVW
jgi:hypothetical protein